MPDGGVPEWSNGAVEPAAARDTGVDAYMIKPVSVRALYHYVVAVMTRSERDALVVGARPSRPVAEVGPLQPTQTCRRAEATVP